MLDYKKVSILLLVLLITSLGGAFYLYNKNMNVTYIKNTKEVPKTETEQIAELVSKVGKLMVLPINEQPTIATVSDPSKLKDQPFFANAQTGDKVLIYEKSGKAILYNPALDKIVEVSPINIDTQTPNTNIQSATTTPATSAKSRSTTKK